MDTSVVPRRTAGRVDFDVDVDLRGPWIASVRGHRARGRGAFADLAPGLLCVWRTRVRLDGGSGGDGDCSLREVIAAMHVSISERLSRRWADEWVGPWADLMTRMQTRLDSLTHAAIATWNERERAFRTRAILRHAAVDAELRALHTARDRGQPLLFSDIAAEREASEGRRWSTQAAWPAPAAVPAVWTTPAEREARAPRPAPAAMWPGLTATRAPPAARTGAVCVQAAEREAAFEHAVVLMLVIR